MYKTSQLTTSLPTSNWEDLHLSIKRLIPGVVGVGIKIGKF